MRRNLGSSRNPSFAEKSAQRPVASRADSVLRDRDPQPRIDSPAARFVLKGCNLAPKRKLLTGRD
jgi:hypothetical protein